MILYLSMKILGFMCFLGISVGQGVFLSIKELWCVWPQQMQINWNLKLKDKIKLIDKDQPCSVNIEFLEK